MLLAEYPDVMFFRVGDILRERRDDAARQFVVYAADGTTIAETVAYDAAEGAAADARAVGAIAAGNEATIRQQAETSLDANRAFLAIASPTNAQNAAHVKALTRQNNGIIRLILNKLDGTT